MAIHSYLTAGLGGHNKGMSKISDPGLPAELLAAATSFGTPLRLAILHLLRHEAMSSFEMADALQIGVTTITSNLTVLEGCGVLTASEPARGRHGRRVRWSVDQQALDHLLETMSRYVRAH